MALLDLIESITNAIDNKKATIGIYIDLKKAFDTIDHKLLLNKLEKYGIRGNANNWVRSYLDNRLQFVHYNGCNSDFLIKSCMWGPSGFNFGPETLYTIH